MAKRKVFISYARQDKPDVDQLVEHLRLLGCDPWTDSSLHGGQQWWDEILQRIAACDIFIPIISDEALHSTACQLEFDWTEALGKPVLPVAVKRPPKALPGRFSLRQIIDYSDPESRDKAAIMLAGGLITLPPAPPLPDPLPVPPAAPLSYLTDLIDLVSQHEALNQDQQRQILDQLMPALRSIDQEERRGSRDILNKLSDRRDLCPSVARTIVRLRSARPASDTHSGKPIDWDDLLGHIQARMLVPVVGPDVTMVKVDDAEQTFNSVIGQRLAERFGLTVPGLTTMDEAVAEFLRERGRDEVDRLYRVINDIIVELDPAPGDALRDLAAIDDLRLFVSTTPDRLLAKAVNEVRSPCRPAREITFSPTWSTNESERNAQAPAATDTIVLNLYGRAASTPEYAIHEEDRTEWLQCLLSDPASLPEWLDHPLRRHSMLFIGCGDIGDFLGRLLLHRFTPNSTRLPLQWKQVFFVGYSGSYVPSLSDFSATHRRKLEIQQLEMAPTEFVAELRARWEGHRAARPRPTVPVLPPSPDAPIFISYLREDSDAARRLRDAITRLGGDVWLDERRLQPGDACDDEILTAIHRTVRLFVPIISANTEREEKGYIFREWRAAVDRADRTVGRPFIVPVIVDEDYEGDPSRYRRVPEGFRHLHFGRAPAGDPDADLLDTLRTEVRAMRRRTPWA